MANSPKKITIAGVIYALLFAGAGAGIVDRETDNKCGGVERWEVKVLTDDLADSINTDPQTTTIKEMNDVVTSQFAIKKNTERLPIERQVYTIHDVFITEAILEEDNDIHIVIEDGKKHSMVAEIPDPGSKCKVIQNSEFLADIRKARKTFLKYKDVYNKRRFDITGVLFVDKEHALSPKGNAPNNVELHPVLKLKVTSTF